MSGPSVEYLQEVAGFGDPSQMDSPWPRYLVPWGPPEHHKYAWLGQSDVPPYWANLKYLLTNHESDYVCYRTGLVIPALRVNLLWNVAGDYRQGNAEQAQRFARANRIDFAQVWPIPEDRIHGIHVRVEGRRSDGRDYRLVPAQSFPVWAGV
jgi:hypothetical protein